MDRSKHDVSIEKELEEKLQPKTVKALFEGAYDAVFRIKENNKIRFGKYFTITDCKIGFATRECAKLGAIVKEHGYLPIKDLIDSKVYAYWFSYLVENRIIVIDKQDDKNIYCHLDGDSQLESVDVTQRIKYAKKKS